MKKNKRAISELVSYVLLIVLAVAMAAATYTFLKQYAEKPLPEEECPEGTSVVFNHSCDNNNMISLTIKNSGRFNVTGVFIKIANKTDSELLYDFWEISPYCGAKSNCLRCIPYASCLSVGQETTIVNASYDDYNKITKIVVIPYRMKENYATLCSNAIASLELVDCN